MANILVAVTNDLVEKAFDDASRAELEGLGDVTWRGDLSLRETDAAAYAKAIGDAKAEIVLTFWGSPKLTPEVTAANPQFKYLCHIAGTLRKIVDREVLAAGFLVTNWGKVISRVCAEASLMMMLCGLRCATAVTLKMHTEGAWRDVGDVEPRSLFERRVGLHGFGAIAQELVALLRPFDATVSAYSPHAPDEAFETLGVTRVNDLKTLYAENELVSIHTGKTEENYHVVNADVLAGMPDGAVLVNTARGEIIDTDALVAELRTGRIHAALDVFEGDALPADSPLRGLHNCQLWPHWGCPTPDRLIDCGRHGAANVRRYLSGQPPIDQITAERYDTMT